MSSVVAAALVCSVGERDGVGRRARRKRSANRRSWTKCGREWRYTRRRVPLRACASPANRHLRSFVQNLLAYKKPPEALAVVSEAVGELKGNPWRLVHDHAYADRCARLVAVCICMKQHEHPHNPLRDDRMDTCRFLSHLAVLLAEQPLDPAALNVAVAPAPAQQTAAGTAPPASAEPASYPSDAPASPASLSREQRLAGVFYGLRELSEFAVGQPVRSHPSLAQLISNIAVPVQVFFVTQSTTLKRFVRILELLVPYQDHFRHPCPCDPRWH